MQVMLSMNAYYIASQGVNREARDPEGRRGARHRHHRHHEGHARRPSSPTSSSTSLLDPAVQAEIATLKKGSPVVTNAKLDPEVAKLPGVFTTRRPVEQGSAGHRPQAARREDRRMAQVVHRERHQLMRHPPGLRLAQARRSFASMVRLDRAIAGRTRARPLPASGRSSGCSRRPAGWSRRVFAVAMAGDPAIQRARPYPRLARRRRLHARQFHRRCCARSTRGSSSTRSGSAC